MNDFIYGENGEIIEIDFELNYQCDNKAFDEFCEDNVGIEYDYNELI